jgi:arabinofuranan 3-O-arabinosyltransferase
MSENLGRGATADEAARAGLDIDLGTEARYPRTPPRLLGVFAAWRLQACGYTLAAAYAAVFFIWYKAGVWLVDGNGVPLPKIDFTYWWVGGTQALHGEATSIYDPAQLRHMLAGLVGADLSDFNNWPYPPIVFLILAPLPMLPYVTAFLIWEAVPLLACIAVVFLIVHRPAAIALVLASPFGAQDIRWAQFGFLNASLLGAALLALERRPVLAGVSIGCLTYKPQFGILIPVALLAARRWRAFASAAITAALLVGVSVAAFGIEPWIAFPLGFLANAGDVLLQESQRKATWGSVQTVYGLVRALDGSAALAWVAQGCAAAGVAVIVWLVWRSPTRYALKAALLSGATLIATPYAWAHDLTVIAIPVAFLARDQIECGLLRGEQTTMLALFGAALAILVSGGWALPFPLGPVIMITLVAVILRRVVHDGRAPEPAVAVSRLPEASRGMPRSASS